MIEGDFVSAVTGFDSEYCTIFEYHQTADIIKLIKKNIEKYTTKYLEDDSVIDKDLTDEGLYLNQKMLDAIKEHITNGEGHP